MSGRSRASLGWAGVALVTYSLGSGRIAGAQLRATLDVGGASIRYADSVRVTATTLAPTARFDGGPFTAVASGSVSALGRSTWVSQGSITTSLLSPSFGVGRLEAAGTGGGTMHQDGARTGQYLGRVRLHASGATRGLWIGAGAGHAWDGAARRRSIEADVAAWSQLNDFTLLGTVRPVASGDSLRYTDFAATVRRDVARWELAASAGVRSGVAAVRGSPNGWAGLSVAIWVAPQLAFVGDGGSYPADLSMGFPGGKYLSAALRIAPRRQTWMRRRTIPTAEPAESRTVGTARSSARLEIVPLGAGNYTVRIHAPGARRVEIMGDFTQWQSAEASPDTNGWWTIVTRITPGVRQLNVRLDGGRWTVPAGTTVEADEFGAPVGVIIVR